DDLDALALQHVGEAGVVLEMGVVERSDQLVLATVPVVKQRRDDAARLEPGVEADAVEHFQGRGMIRSRARHRLEGIIFAERLDQADLDAGLRQAERQGKADRAGADDDDAVGLVQCLAATTSFTAPTQPVWVRSNTIPSGSRYLAS